MILKPDLWHVFERLHCRKTSDHYFINVENQTFWITILFTLLERKNAPNVTGVNKTNEITLTWVRKRCQQNEQPFAIVTCCPVSEPGVISPSMRKWRSLRNHRLFTKV